MSIAWTTVLLIAMLLPGIAFLVGFWSHERHSREIVRSSAVGDIGAVLFFSILLHLGAWTLMSGLFGFDISFYFRPLADHDQTPAWLVLDQVINRLWACAVYIVAMTGAGFVLGIVAAWGVMSGPLRMLGTHKWVYDLLKTKGKRGVVWAYVLTTVRENKRALMYKGHLDEFYLDANGCFTYVVLRNCSKFFLNFEDEMLKTSNPRILFPTEPPVTTATLDYLMIHGSNIANMLFEPSGEIADTASGQKALADALAKLEPKS